MSATFDKLCSRPLLSREAACRVFAAPGLPIRARPEAALFPTLNNVTTDLLHHAPFAIPPVISLTAAARAFREFRGFLEDNPLLAYPPPTPPAGYFSSLDRWFETELHGAAETTRSRGRPSNQFLAYAISNLLALFAIAFEREPSPGSELAPGPTVNFVRCYADETSAALQKAKFEPESEWRMLLKVWHFPSKLQPALRKRQLAGKPKTETASEADPRAFPTKFDGGVWELVAHAFIQHGGESPHRPRSTSGLSKDSK